MVPTMLVRIAIILVVLTVYISLNRVEAGKTKLKIFIPQRIKTIHHYHKQQYHQYARGYGYGPLSSSSRGPQKHHHHHHIKGHKGRNRHRYKKGRGRGRKRYGSKSYGMYNYARKYKNWTRNTPKWKDGRGSSSASYHRPQYALPNRPYHNHPSKDRRPSSSYEDNNAEYDDHDDGQYGHDDGQYHDQDNDEDDRNYKDDRRFHSDGPPRRESANQVGQKIHDSISDIIGLISQYSGHNDRIRGDSRNDGFNYNNRGDLKTSPSMSFNGYRQDEYQRNGANHFYNNNNNNNHNNNNINFHKNNMFNNNNVNHPMSVTMRAPIYPQRDVFSQAFQSFSHGGHHLPNNIRPGYPFRNNHPAVLTHLGNNNPTVLDHLGNHNNNNNNNNNSNNNVLRNSFGDHDIGFGQGLEVV